MLLGHTKSTITSAAKKMEKLLLTGSMRIQCYACVPIYNHAYACRRVLKKEKKMLLNLDAGKQYRGTMLVRFCLSDKQPRRTMSNRKALLWFMSSWL